jgi:hypothetical protein
MTVMLPTMLSAVISDATQKFRFSQQPCPAMPACIIWRASLGHP